MCFIRKVNCDSPMDKRFLMALKIILGEMKTRSAENSVS